MSVNLVSHDQRGAQKSLMDRAVIENIMTKLVPDPKIVSQLSDDARLKSASIVDVLVERLAFNQAMPLIEHMYGVIPLVREFLDSSDDAGLTDDVISGRILAALGLFTPNPIFSWCEAALSFESEALSNAVSGEIRILSSRADCTLVLVRRLQEYRLALLPHSIKGVTITADNSLAEEGPAWLAVDKAKIEPGWLSCPLSTTTDGRLSHTLAGFAGVCALAIAAYAKRTIVSLRRAANATARGNKSFKMSQVVAHEITHQEIEADLLLIAVRDYFNVPSDNKITIPLALATTATRVMSSVTAIQTKIVAEAGIPRSKLTNSHPIPSLDLTSSILGGPLMMEGELARQIGLFQGTT